MSKSHRYIPVAHLYPGMVLGDELLDKQGHLLLPAGVNLSESMITSLIHHQIQQVSIVDRTDAEDEALQATVSTEELDTIRQAQLDRLALLFRYPPDNMAGQELMGYVKKYRTGAV